MKTPVHAELDQKIIDANRAFILYCCTQVNKCLAQGDGDKALNFAKIAIYDSV